MSCELGLKMRDERAVLPAMAGQCQRQAEPKPWRVLAWVHDPRGLLPVGNLQDRHRPGGVIREAQELGELPLSRLPPTLKSHPLVGDRGRAVIDHRLQLRARHILPRLAPTR